MTKILPNWFKKNIISRHLMTNCPDEERCLHLLEVILDDESTPEAEQEYFEHIDQCWPCYQNYNLEKAIRKLIKSKIENKPVPDGLIKSIKREIEKIAIE